MKLTELIKDMKEKGLVSIGCLKFKGQAKPVFEMLAIMNDTEPEETDPNWWKLRLWLRRNQQMSQCTKGGEKQK